MDEGGVDHAVRGCGACAQLSSRRRAAMHFGAGGGERFGRRIGTSKTKHLVARTDQFLDNSRADKSGRAGNKDTHEEFLRV